MSETSVRLSAAETAKLVRQALKAEWPGVKFSVRSKTYSGGASIDVGWCDGPTAPAVDAVTNLYRGADFDGMQDLKTYRSALAVVDGEPVEVRYGADFIFSSRSRSAGELDRLEILAGLNWRNGRTDGRDQCGRCQRLMSEGPCFYSPAAERLVCSANCWALAQHWHTDYTAQLVAA